MDDGIHAVKSFLEADGVGHVPFGQLEEAVLAAGQEAVTAELERVVDADLMALVEEHRDQGRTNITSSAGDQYTHG